MTDHWQTSDASRAIAAVALGRDPGPMTSIQSESHSVYMSADVVVKIIDGDGHSRMDREIALAPHLPIGLAPLLLASGNQQLGTHEVRYACYARAPGTTPGMGMPGVDSVTARLLAEDAVQRLNELHNWNPTGVPEETLREPLNHGGFISHEALLSRIEYLASLDGDGFIPRRLLNGLSDIAKRAPLRAQVDVPIHGDCHWGNWLTRERSVTALLDFEWARYGEPVDDWFFLARFSGPHVEDVLDVISRATTTSLEILRAGCEIREATHITSDLCIALENPDTRMGMAAERLRSLEELITENYWWRHAG